MALKNSLNFWMIIKYFKNTKFCNIFGKLGIEMKMKKSYSILMEGKSLVGTRVFNDFR